MKHKIRIYFCLAGAMMAVSLSAFAAEQKKDAAAGAEPVAKVGDSEVISREEFDRALAAVEQARMVQLRQQGATPDKLASVKLNHEQKMRLLDSMVSNRIAAIIAKESNITISDEDVKAEIEKRKSDLPSGMDYQEFLKQRGMSEEDVFDNTKRRLMLEKLEAQKTSDLTVSDDEVKQQFEKLKERGATDEFDVQHILIKAASADDPGAKEKIDAASARIKKGEDFGAVAKEVSEDPGSKDNGGEYKNVHRGQMVREFDERMAAAKVGEVSDPFRTTFGWHILKVNRHEGGELTPELSERMKTQILGAKRNAFMRKLIDEARNRLNITINLPTESSGAASGEKTDIPADAPPQSLIDAAT